MRKPTVFIDGQAGTTGLQIRELLANDAAVEIVEITAADRKNDAARRALLNQVDLAILCLPDDAAREAVSWIENDKVRVLDASTAHRIAPGWAYGFPEMRRGQAERIAAARLVSNPGCYATGVIALLSPLIAAGVLAPSVPVSVNAISGYSGGGKKMIEEYEGLPADKALPVFRPYALALQHKHVKEMKLHSGLVNPPIFTPAVGAFRQGMMIQIPLQLWSLPKAVTGADLHAALAQHYAGSSVVRVAPLHEGDQANTIEMNPEKFNNTNILEVAVFSNPDTQQAVLTATLDNLGKGASGAAIQNLYLMLGLS